MSRKKNKWEVHVDSLDRDCFVVGSVFGILPKTELSHYCTLLNHILCIGGKLVTSYIDEVEYTLTYGHLDPKPIRKHRIRIFDMKTFKLLKVKSNHRDQINHLIKWNDDLFLSCSNDERILCHSINDPYETEREFLHNVHRFSRFYCSVVRLMKLSDDLFLCLNLRNEILVISFSKNEIKSRIICRSMIYSDVFKITFSLSPNHKFHFYTTKWLNRTKCGIILRINSTKRSSTGRIKVKWCQDWIKLLYVFSNSRNEDIIVVQYSDSRENGIKRVSFYNTNQKKKIRSFQIEDDVGSNSLYAHNKFLLFCGRKDEGDDQSKKKRTRFHIFEMKGNKTQDPGIILAKETRISHRSLPISCHCKEFDLMTCRISSGWNASFCGVSTDFKFVTFRISLFPFEEDENERIRFIFRSEDDNMKLDTVVIHVTRNCLEFEIPRILLGI